MGNFIATTKTLTYQTKYRLEFINITSEVEAFIKEAGVQTGSVTIQTHHTTCGVWVNEDEKNLIGSNEELGYTADLKKVLDRFANPADEYHHNDVQDVNNPNGKRNTHLCLPDENGVIHECINGHAHAQAMIMRPAITLIVENGRVVLGEWQKILLVELDHDRERRVTVLVQGV